MADPGFDGVLRTPAHGTWRLRRWAPPAAVADIVAYGWSTEWSLPPGTEHVQGALPHPAGNVVAEQGGLACYGPISDRFDRTLTGTGRVVGLRLRPGVLGVLTGAPAADVVDRRLDGTVLGLHAVTAESGGSDTENTRDTEQTRAEDVEGTVRRLFATLATAHPDPLDSPAAELRDLVERTARDDAIRSVDELARLAGCGRRTLQRRFAEHVGLGPSWVIHRYRLHRTLGLAGDAERPDWAEVAARVGYYDQAHLIRDFTGTVGTSPGRYSRPGQTPE